MITLTMLADILGTSKNVVQGWVKKKRITLLEGDNLSVKDHINEFPELQFLLNETIPDTKFDKKLSSIELFTGAGGMAIGLERAGFKHLAVNEWDKHACNTLRNNRPSWNVLEGDVSNFSFTEFENVDLLAGGFPCQAFSYAGKQLGFDDTRGTLFYQFARAALEAKPKVILAENVKGLTTHDNGRTFDTIKNIINEIGYTLVAEPKILKAIFHKVPQKRERIFFVAVRNDLLNDKIQFEWPQPHNQIFTLKDALFKGELYDTDCQTSPGQEYPERKKEIMSLVPQGGYWRDLPDDIAKEYMKASYFLGGGKTGMARRLSLNEPSLTLTCAPAQKQTERCHPTENRPLQVREYARVQTFPDDWLFEGPVSAQYKQIGNAVPCNLAMALGIQIHKFILKLNKILAKNQ